MTEMIDIFCEATREIRFKDVILEEVAMDPCSYLEQNRRRNEEHRIGQELVEERTRRSERPKREPEPEEQEFEEEEHDEGPRQYFFPSLQTQRNDFASDVIYDFESDFQVKKIAVLGCGAMSLERSMINWIENMYCERILSVDIDPNALLEGLQKLERIVENARAERRPGPPLLFQAFLGDITEIDTRFCEADIIVSIEVIEHMSLESANKFVDNVLGVYRPKAFILSTPNRDFNPALNMKPSSFRHWDHHYEFSRQEFEDWVAEVTDRHPHYKGEINMVGTLEGFESLGARSFKYAGDLLLPLGRDKVEASISCVAMCRFLRSTELREEDLKILQPSQRRYWSFPAEEIFPFVENLGPPGFLTDTFSKIRILQNLPALSFAAVELANRGEEIRIATYPEKDELVRSLQDQFPM
ncbi:unnamed protein product [Caenorhabditis auriculariae]|uniref:Small RNA 2'-O-methyltransferase n=1 Tax=Caenorhabditis auriculariae TaxID=2777116 RepID=A0A8S1HLX1_9PELO|nr:unnamed protein product [Caenorhabditis auriculariae]